LVNQPLSVTDSEAQDWQDALTQWAQDAITQGQHGILQQALPNVERILLQSALQHTNGHKQEAAKILGWGRNTLTRKLKELNIEH
jgi:Response regulator containing CheY-like receiver, AAA-type ATPase, and DNA-binding domains